MRTLLVVTLATLLAGCDPATLFRPDSGIARGRLPDEEARALAAELVAGDPERAGAALERIVEAEDGRFVAALIELIQANELQLISSAGYNARVTALERLSGQAFGSKWSDWVAWYGSVETEPLPGFASLKAELLGRIDPRFRPFFDESHPSAIRLEEIVWGGVAVEGIPALDDPARLSAEDASDFSPREPVFGVSIGGESRAYPLRILDWHELVNDTVGGVPISLAYCTLCGTGIAFDTRRPDGTPYRFYTSGLLYLSNKLMFDRETESLWNQLTGKPVVGPLVDPERALPVLPMVLTSWELWRARHPESTIISLDTGHERPYQLGEPYGPYFASPETLFPVWRRSERLPTKSRVFAMTVDGRPKAYHLETLTDERVLNDRVGKIPVLLVVGGPLIRVEGYVSRLGPVSYDVGAEVRAFERPATFRAGETPDEVRDDRGRIWRVTDEALIGPDGEQAARIPGVIAYWFGWYAFYPETEVYGGEES